jgi:hypothetical protein
MVWLTSASISANREMPRSDVEPPHPVWGGAERLRRSRIRLRQPANARDEQSEYEERQTSLPTAFDGSAETGPSFRPLYDSPGVRAREALRARSFLVCSKSENPKSPFRLLLRRQEKRCPLPRERTRDRRLTAACA